MIMKIKEAVDVLIKHGICIRHMSACNKECGKCTVSVQDKDLLDAYDIAVDALAICSSTESYTKYVEKAS